MASEAFYLVLGLCASIIFVFGGFSMNDERPAPWTPVAGYIILVGLVFVGIMGIGAYRDIKSRVKDWNADHKYTELEQRAAELELKEREMQIRAREEQIRREEAQRRQEARQREEQRKEEERREEQRKKETLETKYSQIRESNIDANLDDRYIQDDFDDKSILKTGDSFFNIPKKSTGRNVSTKLNPDPEYITRVTSNSSRLKFLWFIYLHDGHFKNQTAAARTIFDGDVSQRKKIGPVFKDFEEFGLITSKVTRSLGNKEPEKEFWLTGFGKKMMENAINENISDFEALAEKYDLEQEKTAQELEPCSFESRDVATSGKNSYDPSRIQETEIMRQTNDAKSPPIRISSNDEEIVRLFTKAKPYYGKNKHKKIISIMDKILQIDPENVTALSNKGHSLSMMNQLVDAEKHFDLALKINPEYVYALGNKAGLYIERNPEYAIELYQKSLEIEDDPHTYSGIATAYANLKRFEDALHYANHALELLDEDDPHGQRKYVLELKRNIEKDLRKQKR